MNTGRLAVFDLGKTNAKLLVILEAGAIIGYRFTTPGQRVIDGIRLLDHEPLWLWLNRALEAAVTEHNVSGLMISTHGCCFALLEDDQVAADILDYEQEVPREVDAAFRGAVPPFRETYSPDLPAGLNFSRHIFWREVLDPGLRQRVDTILCYPQFWGWRFTGAKVSEVSYFGCHSHLWRPLERDFSSLADARGWRNKFPPFRRAGEILGEARIGSRSIAIHNGVHDSNAALYYYRRLGIAHFTLVSTGTWVIVFNTDCPLERLDAGRDMLANVTVDGQPIATARFMGGREYDTISQKSRAPVSVTTLANAIRRGQFALPSFAPAGPFLGTRGRLIGPVADSEQERAALATLYVAAMIAFVLNLLGSENDTIVDGGLANNFALLGVLAALRPDQRVLRSATAEGTALGAAALAFEAVGRAEPFRSGLEEVAPMQLPGLAAYFADWMKMITPA
jgi:sugar (pentulose or hexulose) kinase